ncbi:hypothetical protein GGTG_04943 [Gaeumannomyces tritici R3-111a-1]|uniref:Uncharacterized protein n=1 Tax=Gaeumannomyces tritici (strain R3-111a-1) TaxID=644352 RepID=J3NUI7_GAET3|nr:hypothetical protein GGTG_04943 [Gaeumannomyces tritici R3-111a-1]EJT79860.1 hypothetical protein GGTG_04943 [Gaeumannomyces tritici R3-111a-1]
MSIRVLLLGHLCLGSAAQGAAGQDAPPLGAGRDPWPVAKTQAVGRWMIAVSLFRLVLASHQDLACAVPPPITPDPLHRVNVRERQVQKDGGPRGRAACLTCKLSANAGGTAALQPNGPI